MAWVSVYSTIDGPKLRDFRKRLGCSKFEATGILVYLWLWGLENADKDGRILNADRDDIIECFIAVDFKCKLNFEDIVQALFDSGWIDEDEGSLFLHDWSEWQKEWYKAKERREIDRLRKAEERRNQVKIVESSNESVEKGSDNPIDISKEEMEKEGSPEKKSKKRTQYSVDFEEFWKVYPRQVDKGTAYRKFSTRLKDGFTPEQLITAAKRYAQACSKSHTEQKYIKHAATFLSDTMPFMDYLKDLQQETQIPEGENPFAEFGG